MAKHSKILRFLLSYRQLKGKDVNINCFQGKNLQNTAFFFYRKKAIWHNHAKKESPFDRGFFGAVRLSN